MTEGFVCTNEWVLMERDEVRMTEGGIALPDSVENEFDNVRGVCRGVGDGILVENGERAAMLARVGLSYEYLIVTRKRVRIGGKDYDLVRDRDLIGFHEE